MLSNNDFNQIEANVLKRIKNLDTDSASNDPAANLRAMVEQITVRAAIVTLQEYEKFKQSKD